jgi:hypothetical protein
LSGQNVFVGKALRRQVEARERFSILAQPAAERWTCFTSASLAFVALRIGEGRALPIPPSGGMGSG